MGLQIVNGATGAKVDQIGCCFFQKLLWPNVLGDLKKNHQKFPHKFSHKWVFFGGVWSLCGNWGSMRKLRFNRGMGKLTEEWENFYNKTPLLDAVRWEWCQSNVKHDHLCWLWSRLSIYNAPVIALRELGFCLGRTPISAKWQAGLRGLGKIACFGGVKPKKFGPNFFWGSIIPIKNTFCKKNGPKSPISALGSGRSNLQPLIWACHCQLDDQYRYPKDNTEII